MTLVDELIEIYSEKNIAFKCDENCKLRDLSKERFIILKDDEIKNNNENSVDCIIVDLNTNEEGNYRVILCELTTGKKALKNARNKFQDSEKLIVNTMKKLNKKIYKIDCLLLGKIKKNGQVIPKRYLSQPILIQGYCKDDTIINQQSCGFSIKKLYN